MKMAMSWLLRGLLTLALGCVAATVGAPGLVLAREASQQTASPAEEKATLEAAAAAHPTDALPLARLGLLASRAGNYPEAIRRYRAALARNAALPGLRLNLALALFKNGDYRDALALFEALQAEQNGPERDRLTFLIGMSHYGLGEYAEAVPFLQQASARDADNQSLLLTLAHSCLQEKLYACVLDSYHRMLAHNAESADAAMLVGEALDAMHDAPGAIREFRAAAAANPKEPNVHFALGYILWTQLQLDEAVREFRAELANTPDHPQAMLYMADAEIKLNSPSGARALLQAVLRVAPNSALAHLDMGVLDEADHHEAEALEHYRQAAALAPEDVNAHLRLARLYRSAGRGAEARSEFTKVQHLTEASHAAPLVSVLPNSR